MTTRWSGAVVGIAATAVLTLTGCCLVGAKEPTTVQGPVAVAGDPGEAPPPTAHAYAGESSKLAELVGEDLAGKVAGIKADLAKATSAADFAATYRKAIALSTELSEPMQRHFDAGEGYNMLPDDLLSDYPFYEITYEAEGTAVVIAMTYEPLRNVTNGTPETADDAYLEMLELMYHDARGQGWSNLEGRNWDYGGCSPLGSGKHLAILLAADEALAAGDLFATEIQAVRATVLKDINEDNEYFPYCGVVEFDKPTPKEKLREEVQQILDQVKLSDSEQAALEQRQRAAFGGGKSAAASEEKGPRDLPKRQPRRGKM